MNWDCSDSDFEFVFGNKVCRVHSVLAEFLSPKVARIRKCDPLCSFYTFKSSEIFSAFERLVSSLRSGEAVRVEKSNFAALLRLSQELENDELFSSLLGRIKKESMSVEEAILLLRAGVDLGTAFCDGIGNLRDFVALRFYEIKKEIIDDLDLETSQLLLSSPSLRIKDEDSLYDFVRSRCEKDLRFASLFEFVCFEYLSVDRVESFSSFVSEKLLEGINFGIWRQICRRLRSTVGQKENPRVFCGEPNPPIDVGKLVMVGSSNSGKTAILERIVQNKFSADSPSTVGIDFKPVIIVVDGQQVKLRIWDAAGQERFRSIVRAYFPNAVGFVLVFDITERKTFDDLSMWLNDVRNVCDSSIPMILIGNKGDLSEKRTVTLDEAEQFAQRHKLTYIEASARDGTNVREAFVSLARSICRSRSSSQKKGSRR